MDGVTQQNAALVEEAAAATQAMQHDPELLLTLRRLDLPPVVWDVHEDTAQALGMKAWLPGALRRPAAGAK